MTTATLPAPLGATFCPAFDAERLGEQAKRVLSLMIDGQPRTLREISASTGDPEASVSARLRDLRRGGLVVHRRRRGEPSLGLFEYKVWAP